MGNVITGLDVGSAQIKGVVVCSKKDGALSVVSVFKKPSAGFRKGVIVDVEEETKSLREVVLELQKISPKIPENIFIKLPDDPKIYKLENGQKRWLKNEDASKNPDFDWDKVSPVNQTEFDFYPEGAPIE